MGDPRKPRKKYGTPKKLWELQRIREDSQLQQEYGLKNKRELWRMRTVLTAARREARKLLSKKEGAGNTRAKQLLERVSGFLISKQPSLDDILALTTREILERRLQTLVFRKGFAKTIRQARQFVVHGHIAVDGRKITSPSYLVKFSEEPLIDWFKPVKVEEEAEATSKELEKTPEGVVA